MEFSSFDSVVRQICRNRQDPTAKEYVAVATTLKTVLDQLNMHVFPSVKSVLLPINDNLTVDIPSDAVMVTKVGTKDSKGGIKVFGLDNGLIKLDDEVDCDCASSSDSESTTSEASCTACTFHGCEFLAGNFGELYGYRKPQFQNGRWTPDYQYNRIIIGDGTDAKAGSKVVVEYKPSVSSDNRMIQIPVDAYAMLMYRVFELMAAFENPNKALRYGQLFKTNYDTFKQNYNHIGIEDIIAAFRGTKMSAIKR